MKHNSIIISLQCIKHIPARSSQDTLRLNARYCTFSKIGTKIHHSLPIIIIIIILSYYYYDLFFSKIRQRVPKSFQNTDYGIIAYVPMLNMEKYFVHVSPEVASRLAMTTLIPSNRALGLTYFHKSGLLLPIVVSMVTYSNIYTTASYRTTSNPALYGRQAILPQCNQGQKSHGTQTPVKSTPFPTSFDPMRQQSSPLCSRPGQEEKV